MNPTSGRLLNIARRLAEAHASQSAAQAVAVTGSVASGIADDTSDADLIVLYESLPSMTTLNATREQVDGSPRIYSSAKDDTARFKEGYFVDGVRCDVSHVTLTAFEADMALVLEAHSTDAHAQSRVAGIQGSLPLHGQTIVSGFQDRAAHYPPALSRIMVEKYLNFPPFWVMTEMGVRRGELLYLYQTMVEAEKNLLGVLCGLNRVYLPGDFKRLARLTVGLRFAPDHLAARLEEVLRAEPEPAVHELCGLIRETFVLVEQQMPEADVSWPRAWFELPR